MNQKNPWWGGGEYRLGGNPSPHVTGLGRAFLAKHHQAGKLVADLGVWEGRNLPELISLGQRVAATDTPEARDVLKKTGDRFRNVSFHEAHLDSLPFENEEVGAALCWRVLHNLTSSTQIIAALKEINRILVIGSPLLVAVRSEHQRDFWASRAVFLRRCSNGNGGIREDLYFTKGAVRFIAELLGFRVEGLFEDVEGGEEIDGRVVHNHYLVGHLIKVAKPRPAHQDAAERLIIRTF